MLAFDLIKFCKILECRLLECLSISTCNQVRSGVQAVFGPSDPLLGAHIHSICDALDIPHLEARLDLDTDVREFSINLYPAQHLLNRAFQDVMAFLNWTRVAIIYEEDYGLIKLRELVRSPHNRDLEIHIRQADPDTYRPILKEIKSKEIHNIIIDTKSKNMRHFLKGILQLQMNDYKYHYLFTTFDLETFDLEDFKYNFVNMTAFRVVDAEDLAVQEVLRDMIKFQNTLSMPARLNSSFIQLVDTK
ncbi:Receptor family ligand binding region [Popillia japonica]|uniref:Receptor family ligand binding region n=1 Tax=Popillia japonica TaxID=7064 RepID=A0AAW1N2N6_POPJA